MEDLKSKNIFLKPIVALTVAGAISVVLAPLASQVLDQTLEDRGLPGAVQGLFFGGIFNATMTALLGGVLFGYTFAFHKNIFARMSAGLVLGALVGSMFASAYTGRSFIQLLGVVYFLSFGAFWGSLGGLIFAACIRRIFLVCRLSSEVRLPKVLSDRVLIISSIVTLISACIPLAFSGDPTIAKHTVYVVTSSSGTCREAQNLLVALKVPPDVYEKSILHTVNGTYSVSIGSYPEKTAQKLLVSAVSRSLVPTDSFLVSESNIIKSDVQCN